MSKEEVALTESKFDLLVVGGGIVGSTLTWLASLTGLKVALIEKFDFSSGASSASQKIVHSGIRYLQHADFPRSIESINSRLRLEFLAPHLVRPIDCALPFYGAMTHVRAGALAYRLMSAYRAAVTRSAVSIRPPGIISRAEILDRVPEIPSQGLRGALVWEDAQVLDTERLVLAFLRSANEHGAVTVNYVKAERIEAVEDRVLDIFVRSNRDEEAFQVRTSSIVDCTGSGDLLATPRAGLPSPSIMGMNLITRPVSESAMAFGLRRTDDPKAGAWFVTPWRGKSIIGTRWMTNQTANVSTKPDKSEVERFIEGFNRAHQGRPLEAGDVYRVLCGRVPATLTRNSRRGRPAPLERTRILDHADDGMSGAYTVLAPKYTTALTTAETVLRRLVPGYAIPAMRHLPPLANEGSVAPLTYAALPHCDNNREITTHGPGRYAGNPRYPDVDLLRRQTRRAVEVEWATHLQDVVLRRCGLVDPAGLPDAVLDDMAKEMGQVLGWNESERRRQVEDVKRCFLMV